MGYRRGHAGIDVSGAGLQRRHGRSARTQSRTPVSGSLLEGFDSNDSDDVVLDIEDDCEREPIKKYTLDRQPKPSSRMVDANESAFDETAEDTRSRLRTSTRQLHRHARRSNEPAPRPHRAPRHRRRGYVSLSTCCATQARQRVIHRYQLRLTGIDPRKPPLDLASPRFLCIRVELSIEAFDELRNQSRPIGFAQRKGVIDQLVHGTGHPWRIALIDGILGLHQCTTVGGEFDSVSTSSAMNVPRFASSSRTHCSVCDESSSMFCKASRTALRMRRAFRSRMSTG